jgi:flagellar hook-length control protein FliK
VSHNQSPTKLPQDNDGALSSDSAASDVGGDIDETTDPAASTAGMATHNEQDTEPVQIPPDWNFAAFIKVLEGVGVHDAIEGSDSQKLADLNPSDGNQLAAVKMLMDRLQQNQSGPTADLQEGLQRLRQFLANARDGRDFTTGMQEQKENSGLLMEKGATDVKLAGTMPAETGVVAQATEKSAARSQLENQSPVDPKLSSDTRPLVSINNQDSHPKAAADSENADPSKAKDALDFLRENRIDNRAETANRMGPVPGQDQPNTTANAPDSQSQKPNPSSGLNPSIVKFSESLIQSTVSEEPLSKVFQEAQLAKEGVVRVDSGSIEETVSKVIKTEAGSSDNGLLNSSGQNTEKLAEPAPIQKDAETRQSELRNQTMDQIVRRAAIHLRNGQHEARIELKPDFLGHIRMQVISENQQVTVKILAQHGFVKDMIESNVHQLKADLQQQGLEVDKLEVTVARDSEDSANYKDKLSQSKFRQGSANRHSEDRPTEEQPEKPRRSPLIENGSSTVDYFA